ncbi:hypothetical protein Tco_1088743, partial [Tanacetum coccineum]
MKILQQRSEHEHTLISQIKKNFVNQLISRQQTLFSKYQPQVVTHSLVVHQQPYQAPALQQSYQAPATQQPTQPSFLELDSGLDVPIFNTSDDPIASLNKAMAFLSITFASCFPQTNNHLRTSSNPRNQATIQDGRGANRNGAAGQARVVKCYNCQEEEDNGDTFTPVQASQEIPSPAAFQTDDLDVFYSDCDDVPSTKAFLMANLSSYNSDVLSEKQLSAEQAYWFPISQPVVAKPPVLSEPVLKKEITRELLPINLVKDSFQKMKEHVNKFDETITFHTKMTENRIDKKYLEIEKKEPSLDNDHLLEHIICQDVMNVVMHADHSDNVLPANNNSLEHDNSALELLKHENDRLMELLISQDLVHTAVNSLAAINDYKSMEQSFLDEYEENLKLKAELAKKNDMIDKAVY